MFTIMIKTHFKETMSFDEWLRQPSHQMGKKDWLDMLKKSEHSMPGQALYCALSGDAYSIQNLLQIIKEHDSTAQIARNSLSVDYYKFDFSGDTITMAPNARQKISTHFKDLVSKVIGCTRDGEQGLSSANLQPEPGDARASLPIEREIMKTYFQVYGWDSGNLNTLISRVNHTDLGQTLGELIKANRMNYDALVLKLQERKNSFEDIFCLSPLQYAVAKNNFSAALSLFEQCQDKKTAAKQIFDSHETFGNQFYEYITLSKALFFDEEGIFDQDPNWASCLQLIAAAAEHLSEDQRYKVRGHLMEQSIRANLKKIKICNWPNELMTLVDTLQPEIAGHYLALKSASLEEAIQTYCTPLIRMFDPVDVKSHLESGLPMKRQEKMELIFKNPRGFEEECLKRFKETLDVLSDLGVHIAKETMTAGNALHKLISMKNGELYNDYMPKNMVLEMMTEMLARGADTDFINAEGKSVSDVASSKEVAATWEGITRSNLAKRVVDDVLNELLPMPKNGL